MIEVEKIKPETIQGKKLKIGIIEFKLKLELNAEEKNKLEEELYILKNEVDKQPRLINPRLGWIKN